MKYVVHGSKMIVNSLSLEWRFETYMCDISSNCFYRSWSGIDGCCGLTQLPTVPHLQPDNSADIWVKPQATTNAWVRSVEAGRNVGHVSKLRSQVGKLNYHFIE